MELKKVRNEEVPSLGLGTYRLTGKKCAAMVEAALSIGYRHLDTARMYGNEEEVGKGIRSAGVDREDIFLVTKIWPDDFSRDDVPRATDDSLKKLGTDYVDLLLMHWPGTVPLEETLDAMRELREEGKVRHVGVSNFSTTLVEEASEHAEIFCNQVKYSPYEDQGDLRDQAQRMDYLLTAYSPIARGRVLNDPTLEEIGAAHGKTLVQVTLRWLVQQENVAAIPKASSEDRLKSNFDIFDFELSDEEMSRIFSL
ncbi:MAG: aldo/keto reductase [Rubrobacteraceae bacterium]